MTRVGRSRLICLGLMCVWLFGRAARAEDGARTITFYGYDDCIELRNESTRAILCPAAGGRILLYGIDDQNILYLPEGDEGWVWDGQSGGAPMNAGRCDIGPEQVVPRRPLLWQGRWRGEITGPRTAVLRSQSDPSTGVRLERTFTLANDSSKLDFTQTIINVSDRTVEYCHWSRTFVNGHGHCIVPVSEPKRFPQHYVRYDPPGKLINFAPSDPSITLVDDCLIIKDHPLYPKLGFDSHRGWLAYCSPQNLLFVKRFATFPTRSYNEVAGLTISVWYPDDQMVELEPIGPAEPLAPGARSSFTETWYLLARPFVESTKLPVAQIKAEVEALR